MPNYGTWELAIAVVIALVCALGIQLFTYGVKEILKSIKHTWRKL